MQKKIRIASRVLDRLLPLSGSAFKTYAAILRLAGRKAPHAEATYRQIAMASGLARSTVVAAVRELSAAGLLAVERRPDAAVGNRPNIYTLVIEA